MPSASFTLFNSKRRIEVLELVSIFRERNKGKGPNTDYALLNSALLLLVASWEVYCEDTCQIAMSKILKDKEIKFVDLPPRAKAKFINSLREKDSGIQNPQESPFAKLPDKGWKKLYAEEIRAATASLNTPRFTGKKTSHDVNGLFEWIIAGKLSTQLNEFLNGTDFCDKIENAINLRGAIAHKGKPLEGKLTAGQVEEIVALFCAAAAAIEFIVKIRVYKDCGILLWKITHPVRTALEGWTDKEL